MNKDELPEHWEVKLKAHLYERGDDRDQLLAHDFGMGGVILNFEDGSEVSFRHAFSLIDDVRKEIAVFTEHWGYHIFPLCGTDVGLFDLGREA